MRKLKNETIFQIVINIILIILTLCSLLPFVLLIMSSVTQESALIADGYQFWPRAFSLMLIATSLPRQELFLRRTESRCLLLL